MIYAPVLIWWLLLQLFGLVGLPLAFRLLGNLPDRGYAFARPLGLLLTGYLLWLGSSLGFWSNSVGGTLIALLLVVGVGVWLYRGRKADGVSLLDWLRSNTGYWLTVEILFAVALVAWTVYKSYNPNFETAGGEKWMEIAFVNATLRSDSFPPQDPWLSGFGISYYYFGYVLMAMVTRLSGLPSVVAYNLFIPTLFALTLTGAFSLVYNLVLIRSAESDEAQPSSGRALGFGLLGTLFVGIMGHLEGLLEMFHSRGLFSARFWRWLDILDINQPPTPGSWIPTRFIWWWRGSRVIHDCSFRGLLVGDCNPPNNWEVIDEFPFFSFMLGDVHPHVLALPFVLLALALALSLMSNIKHPWPVGQDRQMANGENSISNLQSPISVLQSQIHHLISSAFGGWGPFILYAVCLGALGFLNTWDFPIYLFVVAVVFGLGRAAVGSRTWLREAIGVGLALGVWGGVLYLPFYLGFQSQAGGILPNLINPTRLPQFLVFFGPFLFVVVSYLAWLSRKDFSVDWRKALSALALTLGVPVLVILPLARGWLEGILNDPSLQAVLGDASLNSLAMLALRVRLANPWTSLLLGGLLAWVLLLTDFKFQTSGLRLADTFALTLIGVGLMLPLAVEFIYLRDLFGLRMNTVFKFYFQAWVLLGLAAAYGVFVLSSRLRGLLGVAWQLAVTLLVLAGMVYPVLALPNKAGNFRSTPTLDGMAWLQTEHPDDYAAILWLRANAPDGAVILEAPGDSYTYKSRVSALTGLPTVLGWSFHEFQWRGTYDEPARREPDIEILFNTLDPAQTLTLLDKYDITYVYVGPLERSQYTANGLAKFDRLMDLAYQQGQVTIYRRRDVALSP